jgi:amino acid adenylation domain-containing protein
MTILSDIFGVAQATPERLALQDARGALSYAELLSATRRLAHRFREAGVGVGDRVAIFMENSNEFIIAILAAIQTGAAWVPLNYTLAVDKLAAIAAGCAPRVVVAGDNQLARVAAIFSDSALVSLDGLRETAQETSASPPELEADVSRLAYIIYTSGSTGLPKGVAVEFASLNNYVYRTCDDLGFHAGTRTLSVTPYYFDAPLGSIFCTLVRGGALYIYPNLLHPRLVANKILDLGITYIGTTPGLFRILVEALQRDGAARAKLEVVGVGGDISSPEDLLAFMERCPETRVFNRYGPTETTSVASSFPIARAALGSGREIPIGRPLSGVNFYLFDEAGKQVTAPLHKAELYIGGVQVMRGYYGDAELTEAVLRRDLVAGDVLYKTNDICSLDEQGQYVYHSRIGGLLKRFGVRTHLSEMELAVKACATVRDCVCLSATEDAVVAFVMAEGSSSSEQTLAAELFAAQPRHLVPDDFMLVPAFPYTTVGKINRTELLRMYRENRA